MVLFLSFLLVVAADQLTKICWVGSYDEGELIHQFGFLRLIHVQNTGAVFGLFQGQSSVLVVVAVVEIIGLLVLGFFVYRRFAPLVSLLNTIALGLMLGGIVGNLIDRLRLGSVTDFIDFGVWPVFNIADSAITIGVVLLACSLLRLTIVERRRST